MKKSGGPERGWLDSRITAVQHFGAEAPEFTFPVLHSDATTAPDPFEEPMDMQRLHKDSYPSMQASACYRPGLATLVVALATIWVGCATPPKRVSPLPQDLASDARVLGLSEARRWGDERPPGFEAWLALPRDELRERFQGIMDRPHHYLVLSGGGSNGAFGAGLLTGWSEHGDRPEFQIVTGISTGALIAPFAFLGSDYDTVLREMYTTYSSDDLFEKRGLLRVLRADAATSTEPLRQLIAEYIDADVIAAIAAEARKGRSLHVGTTNLDAGRSVIWDVTRIAASGVPGSADLIHDVVLASASIPGVFPPVLIDVEARGRRYTEMHVDGGVTSQLFLEATGIEWRKVLERLGVQGPPSLYLVRNAKLSPSWKTTEPRLLQITQRSLESLIRAQGIGDLARIYVTALESGFDFKLAAIPEDFSAPSSEAFDLEYMAELFERGREMARTGYPWSTIDPD